MKLAKNIFLGAGIWGLLVMTPLYFMYDTVGRQYPPPITHPDMYYGFVSVTWVWQIAYFVISTDPVRYRPFMLVGILAKTLYFATMSALYVTGGVQLSQLAAVTPDLVLAVLFAVAFVRTPRFWPSSALTVQVDHN
ncbi:MAG TPA: hypothetical protein VF219_10540 [Vicinamibacterales bacterium]